MSIFSRDDDWSGSPSELVNDYQKRMPTIEEQKEILIALRVAGKIALAESLRVRWRHLPEKAGGEFHICEDCAKKLRAGK